MKKIIACLVVVIAPVAMSVLTVMKPAVIAILVSIVFTSVPGLGLLVTLAGIIGTVALLWAIGVFLDVLQPDPFSLQQLLVIG